jgi:hypothetical protein
LQVRLLQQAVRLAEQGLLALVMALVPVQRFELLAELVVLPVAASKLV